MRHAISPLSAEAQFLLTCCDPTAESKSFSEPLDWQWILRWALIHELVPAVCRRASGAPFCPPEPVRDFLTEYSSAVEKYCASAWEQTAELRSKWSKAGVETLIWPATSSGSGPTQSRMARFPEFFVRPKDLPLALEILQKSAYIPRQPANLPNDFQNLYTHILFQGQAGGGISLRWAVPGRSPDVKSLDAIWRQSESSGQLDLHSHFPTAADALLLLVMLGAESGWATLNILREFAQAAASLPRGDWGALMERARKLGCYRRLLLAIALGNAAGIGALRDAGSVRAARNFAAGFFSLPKSQSPFRNLTRDLLWLDSIGQRARYVWRFLFTPTEADYAGGMLGAILRPLRLAAASFGMGGKACENEQSEISLSSFVATPLEAVDQMLDLAGVGPEDVVYDLGCGDGRIVIRAAERFRVRGVGVDLSSAKIKEAMQNSSRKGVDRLVRFEQEDLNKTDLQQATVVILALPVTSLLEVGATLAQRVRFGTRIVSLGGDTGDWEEVRVSKGAAYPQPIFLRKL